MQILELHLRNYRVFEEVDLELPARVIGVFGPNGAGKSTLMEAIAYGLYGWSRTAKNLVRTQGLLTVCEVQVIFSHAGSEYSVRRMIRGKNHATDAELLVKGSVLADGVTEVDAEVRRLLRMDQQVFRASAFAEQKQLDAFSDLTKSKRKEMVLRLLGIKPVDDARARARSDARALKGDAERLAGNLPDLGALEAERTALAQAAASAAREATGASEVFAGAQERSREAEAAFAAADAVRARAEQVTALRAVAAAELERTAKRTTELQARIATTIERVQDVAGLREEREALGEVDVRLAAARELVREGRVLEKLETELAALPDVDGTAALAGLESAEAARANAQQAAAEAAAKHTVADEALHAARLTLDAAGELDPSEPCPTCRQPLGDAFEDYVSHRRDDVARLEKEAARLKKAAAAAAAEQARADTRAAAARAAAESAQTILTRRSRLTADAEAAREHVGTLLVPFDGSPPDVSILEAAAARARELDGALARLEADAEQLERLEADLVEATAEAGDCRTRVEDLDREATGLAFDAEEHGRLAKERDEARALLDEARAAERAAATRAADAAAALAGVEGRLAQARETVERVGSIRDEARYVERVGVLLDGFRDHLVARIGPELSREAEALFRELTNHEYEDLRISDDDLAIEIADGGAFFGVERFSGSEADLANLALRVAISVHLSRMSGADIGMLVLDEVLGSLDAERKDLMVQAMGRLADRFQQLFVITHSEQVKDQFPTSIEVRKSGRRRSVAALV